MNQILDYIGSLIIGGIILIMIVAFNGNVLESSGVQVFKTTVQSNLTTVTDIIETDIRKMGYRVAMPVDSAITYADTSKIIFKGDFDDNGTIDSLQYYLSSNGSSLTNNPKDSVLYRKLNNNPAQPMFVGITKFKLRYYDRLDSLFTGNRISNPSLIKSLKLSISIESNDRILDSRRGEYLGNALNDTTYSGVYWERKIKPKNLR